MALIDEKEELNNVVEEEQTTPVVEELKEAVPRVGEGEGFVDTQLVSQAPVVNDKKMPTEGFVSAGMSGPVTEEGPKVVENVSDINSTIPREESVNVRGIENPVETEPLTTNEIYSSDIPNTRGRTKPSNEELLGPKVDVILQSQRDASSKALEEAAKLKQINTATRILLGRINPETGRYEDGLVEMADLVGNLNPVQVLFNSNSAITRANDKISNSIEGQGQGVFSEFFAKDAKGNTVIPPEVLNERLQDFYIKNYGDLDEYYEDMNNHILDTQIVMNTILAEQLPLLVADVTEAAMQFPISIIDFVGAFGGGGSIPQLYREFFPSTKEGEEQYDRFKNSVEQNLTINSYEKTLDTDAVDNEYYHSVIPDAGELFADLLNSEEGNLGYLDRSDTFGNRLKRAANTNHPEHLSFKAPTLREATLGLPLYGVEQGFKVLGNLGEFAKNMGPVGYNSFLKNHPTYTNIMEFGFSLMPELLIEKGIRKAIVHNNRALFLDSGSGLRVFLSQQEELTKLSANNLKQQIKKNRTLNRKFSRVKTQEGYGGWLKSIDRDVNLQALSFGAGYTGLEILDVFEDRPLTGAAALLALGIFGPTALDSMYQGVKSKLGIGPTARIEFYLAGGGTLDDFIKSQKSTSPFVRNIENLDEWLSTKTDKDKLRLIKANDVEVQSIIRFGEQLKSLKDSNPKVYKEMIQRMEKVRKLRTDVLNDFNPQELVGRKFEDSDGNTFTYDLEQIVQMKDDFVIFLDEFINSGTLKAVRTGLQDNVANLNAFGKLNKKIVLGDIDRYLQIEGNRNEFLAMNLKRLMPIFQQSNEGASQTIDAFRRIIEKTEVELAEAERYQEGIKNLTVKETALLDSKIMKEENWITETEANIESDKFILDGQNIAVTPQQPKVVAGTSINVEDGEIDPLELFDGESPSVTILEASQGLSPSNKTLSSTELDKISEDLFIGVYTGDKAVIDLEYNNYRGADHSITVSNKPGDIFTDQPDVSIGTKEKRVKENVIPDSSDYTSGRKTTDNGDLIVTFGDDTTEIIPAYNKLAATDNLPSRIDDNVYYFGEGTDAIGPGSRQVFPSTEGYETLESFIRSTDEPLSKLDTKERLRIWRISEDKLDALKEGYLGEVLNFDPNDPFNIEFNIAKLDEELKGVSGLSEDEISRYVNIHNGGQAKKPADKEFFKLRADNVDEVDVFNYEDMSQQEILKRLAEIEEAEFKLLKGANKSDLMDKKVEGIGGYYKKIRGEYIDSFEDVEALGDYVKLRIDEIEAVSGTEFSSKKRAALYNTIEKFKRGDLDGADPDALLRKIKIMSKELLEDQPMADVIINANDIHQIRSHFGKLAYKNYGEPTGNKYRIRSAALNEFIEIAFPKLRALNTKYKSFAEQYKQGPFSLIKDKDSTGERVVPSVKFTETFLNYKDPVKAVAQFQRLLGQTTGPDGKLIMLDPKKVAPMRDQAFNLLFYTIAERMSTTARGKGRDVTNLLSPSDRAFLQEGLDKGIFSGNLTNPNAKYDHRELVTKLINWDNYNRTFRRSMEQVGNEANILFQKKVRLRTLSEKLVSANKFVKMQKTDETLFNWFEGTTEQELNQTIDELVEVYKSEGMDLSKFIRERPYFKPSFLNTKPDLLFTNGELDLKKVVKYDMQESINRAVNHSMIRVNSSKKVTQMINLEMGKVTKYESPTREGFMPRSSDESLKEAKSSILKLGDEIMVPELGKFLDSNAEKLTVIYGKKHVNNLRKLHELTTVVARGKDDIGFTGKPGPYTVPGMMSRVFAWYRGVIGTKYIIGELGLNRYRMAQSEALQNLIANPGAVDLLLEAFKSDAPLSSIDTTKVVSVLKGIFLIPETESDADTEQAWKEVVAEYRKDRGIIVKPSVKEQIDNLK